MHINELFHPDVLEAEIFAKHIRVNDHSELPFRLFNYTEITQYERAWNDVTRTCRGLIINHETGQVLARPFPKFFNSDEPGAQIHPGRVTVFDKLDGSLGILYPAGDVWQIATRGSFTSEQAIHATAIFNRQYGSWQPPAGITVMFEIIYPENRIVLDYGPLDDLVLLGGMNIETGQFVAPEAIDWPGHAASVFPFESLSEALAAPPRTNAEGYVIYFHETGARVKIKQADYVALHRIVTGWNERTIWEHLAAGETLGQLIDGLPDEFHQWATSIAAQLTKQHDHLTGGARAEHHAIVSGLPMGWTRKDYAAAASQYGPFRPALFSLLDGKNIDEWAWKQIRPSSTKEASIV